MANPFGDKLTLVSAEAFPRVTSKVQKERDKKRVDILKAEREAATDPKDIESLDRELHGGEVTTFPKAANPKNLVVEQTEKIEGAFKEAGLADVSVIDKGRSPEQMQLEILQKDVVKLDAEAGKNPFGDAHVSNVPTREINPLGDSERFATDPKGVSVNPFGDPELATLRDNLTVPFKGVPAALNIGVEGVKQLVIEGATAPPEKKTVLQHGLDVFNPLTHAARLIDTFAPDIENLIPEGALERSQKSVQESQAELKELTTENPSLPLQVATGAAQSIAMSTPGLIASIATRNPLYAIVSGGLQEAGRSFAEARTPDLETGEIKANYRNALKNAITKGVIEAGLELFPVLRLFKDMGKAGFLRTVRNFILTEELTELPTTLLQKISDRIHIEPDKPLGEFLDELQQELILTGLTTPFAAGGSAGVAIAVTKPFQKREQKKKQKLFDEMQKAQDAFVKAEAEAIGAAPSAPIDISIPAHRDIPVEPLTPDEEVEAARQQSLVEDGSTVAPVDPVAQAEAQEIEERLNSPTFRQPEESKDKAAEQYRSDIDRGMTPKVAARRAREMYPNQQPAGKRTIAYSTQKEQVGMTLEQTVVQPDSVVVLAGNEEQYSEAYTQAIGETVRIWAQQFMPKGTRLLINLSGLTGTTVGAHFQTDGGIQVITPREVARADRAETLEPEGVQLGLQSGRAGYNVFTQNQTFGAITHEFGHALVMTAFAKRMPAGFENIVSQLDSGKAYSPEELAQLPAEEGAVIKDFQDRKVAILSGDAKQYSAEQLAETWFGVWKVGQDVAVQKNRKSLYKYALNRLAFDAKLLNRPELQNRPLSQISALDLVHAMGRKQDVSEAESNAAAETYFLRFNEYMAEQFSRYAHVNRIDEGTPLGVYFKRALESLRAFFKSLKSTAGIDGEAVIKPGTTFTEWVDQLARSNAQITADRRGKQLAAEAAVRATPAIKARVPKKPKVAAKVKRNKKPKDERIVEEVVAQNPKAPEEGQIIGEMQEMALDPMVIFQLRERIKLAIPNKKDDTRAELMSLVSHGQLMLAEEMLVDWQSEQINKDVKEVGGAWSVDSVNAFSGLATAYTRRGAFHDGGEGMNEKVHLARVNAWWRKAAGRYLNKLAGTKNDPLKDLLVPFQGGGEKTWGEIMDSVIQAESIEEHRHEFPKAPPNTSVWRVTPAGYDEQGRFNSAWISQEYITISNYMRHVSDYLAANVLPSKLVKYDLVRAFQEVHRRDAARIKRMSTTTGMLEGTEVVKTYPEGFQWVNVKTAQALENEGDAMGHCVGDYCGAVAEGFSTIWSLRDPQGQPHVTIEILPSEGNSLRNELSRRTPEEVAQGLQAAPQISQIRGKANAAPIAEYISYVQDIIRTERWSYVSDLESVDMVDIRSIYLGIPSFSKNAWTEEVAQLVGNESPYQIWKEIEPLHTQFVNPLGDEATPGQRFDGPFLDEGSPDSEEVRQNLSRIGWLTESIPFQRAINFMKDASHYVQQMQQIAHQVKDSGAIVFIQAQNQFQALKNTLLAEGTDIAKGWEDFSPSQMEKFELLMNEEFMSGGHVTNLVQDEITGKWEHQAGPAMIDFMHSRGINPQSPEGKEIAALWIRVKNSILEHIQVIENEAISLIKDQYRRAPLVVRKRSAIIRSLAEKWREAPFVPQGHYGNYVVKIFGTNKDGEREVIRKEHFQSAAEQDAAVRLWQKKAGADNVKWFKISTDVGQQLSLPLDFLETLKDTGEFSDGQLEKIGGAMMPLRGEKAFTKFERDNSTLTGAEPDMLRNYANWIEDSANFTAKWVQSRRMTNARALTRSNLVSVRNVGDVAGARDLQRLLDTMSNAQDLMMHPKAEFYKTRSVIALTYLMWAPKTALMNLTGMFQTAAALTADYGDVHGAALFGGAIRDSARIGTLSMREKSVLDRALRDGVIDQGFGYFMSGLANAGNLRRRVRKSRAGKFTRGFVDAGMYPFKAVEYANRRVTMLAFYRAEYKKSLQGGKTLIAADAAAYAIALQRTRLLQNDYASGNRPPILTGRKSIAMIFLSYPQYMLWILGGGYERGTRAESRLRGEDPRSWFGGTTMRMWLVFLAFAGVEGVPFGEMIIDIMQLMWKKFGTGENLRVEGQRFMKETLEIESPYWRNVIQRGLFHNIGGVDLSGSYSLGTPLPGTGLFEPHADTWREFIGEAFEEFTGPFGGAIKGGVGLAVEDKDLGLRELGQNLPAAAGSIARAATLSTEGLTTSRGDRILKDDEGNFRDPTTGEILATGAGFRLTEVAEFQQLRQLKRQQADYWSARRLQIKRQFQESYRDPKTRSDMLEVIRKFNAEVPFGGLRIGGKELSDFLKRDITRIRKLEKGIDSTRNYRLEKDIEQVFSGKTATPRN